MTIAAGALGGLALLGALFLVGRALHRALRSWRERRRAGARQARQVVERSDATTRRLERFVWVMAAAVIASGWLISYTSLRLLAVKVGHYGELEALLYPLPIDFTLGGAVASLFLLARWGASGQPRVYVGTQILLSAAATVAGNALHGLITGDGFQAPWWGPVAVSAVPGAAIAGMTHAATLMLRHRPRAEEERPVARRTADGAPAPVRRERTTEMEAHPPAVAGDSKREQVRALLEEHGALTGSAIAKRLGITPGYARKLRDQVSERSQRGASGRPASLPPPGGVRLVGAGASGAGSDPAAEREVSA